MTTMKWFEGPIPEAIQVSRQKGSLFLVYIFGSDDLSEQMNATWESGDVAQFCGTNEAIAIRIQNTSEECKFFSQIYPVVVVPSTFCIGEGGVPLEVIGGHVTAEELVQKLQRAQETFTDKKQTTTATPPPSPSSGAMTPETSSSTAGGADGDQNAAAVPLEQKLEKAKELLEKKKIEKAQQEYEKNREEEIKRRKLGHDLHKLKQTQQETELKEIRDKLKKDKEDDKKAKEKIRAQIAKDREERQAKFQKEKQDREKGMEEDKRIKLLEQQRLAAEAEARKSDTARIQIRLPDGSSVTHSFPSSETLQSLNDFIAERVGGRVSISTTFPKRRFTQEDMSSTFAELQLAPSAAVMALPEGRSTRQASSSVATGGFLSLIFAPFMFLWNFLYSLLFGGGGNSQSTTSQRQSTRQSSNQSQTNTRTNRPTTAYQRRSPASQEGNVRRMTDMRDDDDDMTTYNGNSTQQM